MDKNNNRFDNEKKVYKYRKRQEGPVGLTVLTILFIVLLTILWIAGGKSEMGMAYLGLAILIFCFGGVFMSLMWIFYFMKLTIVKKKNNDKNWWSPIIGIAILIFIILFIHNEFG